MALEPSLNLGVFMGRVVVDDEMEIERFGDVVVDGAQKAQELLMTMAAHAFADDLAGGDVERREQGRRSVSLVVVGHRAGAALLQRQSRLSTIERLNLALFVDRQHQRLVRRVEIKPDTVLNLLTELGIVGQLEAARQMRLEPMRRSDALHARMAQDDRLGHFAQRPVGAPRRLLVERLDCHRVQRRLAAGTGGVAVRARPRRSQDSARAID